MAAPLVQSVTPLNLATSVVLGTMITVTFDQLMDTSTISDKTFSVTGPGQTGILAPEEIIAEDPSIVTGREYITGDFSFATVSGKTVVTFTPRVPLRKNATYDVLLVGTDSELTSTFIKNVVDEVMALTYEWSFTTGDLNVVTPPDQSPLPALQSHIDPNAIRVLPRPVLGNDLSQMIELIFPDNIDPSSFNLADILVSVEAMLGDPSVVIPPGLLAQAVINGRRLQITITGW